MSLSGKYLAFEGNHEISKTYSFGSRGGGVALIGAVSVLPAQAFTIDTTPGEFNGISPLGEYTPISSASFGQTFFAPTDNILNEFSFFLYEQQDSPNDEPVTFRAFVAAFDSTTNTLASPILFESSSRTAQFIVTDYQTFGKQTFTFNTGGLALNAGQEYVAFLSPLKDLNGVSDSAALSLADESVAPYEDGGGRLVYTTAGSFSDLTTQPFFEGAPGQDLGFKASFSSTPSNAVPEPTTILGTLLFGSLGGSSWLKRRKKAK